MKVQGNVLMYQDLKFFLTTFWTLKLDIAYENQVLDNSALSSQGWESTRQIKLKVWVKCFSLVN